MSDSDTVFAGSIPAIYDSYMVPMIFRPYAEVATERAKALAPKRILETAAGTGVLTALLHQSLEDAEIVATDLNQPMLDQAARRISSPQVRFVQADAAALPFENGRFDLVACQFGAMFFPDKIRAHSEARRVLADGGTYLLLIWDSIEKNVATRAAGRAVADLFPHDSNAFFERIPFRYCDTSLIDKDLRVSGFRNVAIETIQLQSRAPTARHAAIGLTQGTPMRSDIEKVGPGALEAATDAAEAALRQFEMPSGFDAPMSAHLVTAVR